MAQKLNLKNLNLKKTKETLDKILVQAKESVKVLESLQKEGVARARAMIHLPTKDDAQRMANEKFVMSLKKLGLASRAEIRELEKKVEDLASELRAQISKVSRKSSQKSSKNDEARESDFNG